MQQEQQPDLDAVCPPVQWHGKRPNYGTILLMREPSELKVWKPCIVLPPASASEEQAHQVRQRLVFRDVVRLSFANGSMDIDDFEYKLVDKKYRRMPEQPWPVGTVGLVDLCGADTLAMTRTIRCRVVGHVVPQNWQYACSDSKLVVLPLDLPPTFEAENLKLDQRGHLIVDRFSFFPLIDQTYEPTLHSLGIDMSCRIMVRELDAKEAKREHVGYAIPVFSKERYDSKTAIVWVPERGVIKVPVATIISLPFKKGDRIWAELNESKEFATLEVLAQEISTVKSCGWRYTARHEVSGKTYDIAHAQAFDANALIHHLRVRHKKLGECRIHNPHGQVEFIAAQGQGPAERPSTAIHEIHDEKKMTQRVKLVPTMDAWGCEIKSELLQDVQPDKRWEEHLRAENAKLDKNHPDFIGDAVNNETKSNDPKDIDLLSILKILAVGASRAGSASSQNKPHNAK